MDFDLARERNTFHSVKEKFIEFNSLFILLIFINLQLFKIMFNKYKTKTEVI